MCLVINTMACLQIQDLILNTFTFGVLRGDERRWDKRSTPWPKENAVSCWVRLVKFEVNAPHWQTEYYSLTYIAISDNWFLAFVFVPIFSRNPPWSQQQTTLDAKYHVLSVTRPLWWGTWCWHGSAISIHITHYTGARHVTRDQAGQWCSLQVWPMFIFMPVPSLVIVKFIATSVPCNCNNSNSNLQQAKCRL